MRIDPNDRIGGPVEQKFGRWSLLAGAALIIAGAVSLWVLGKDNLVALVARSGIMDITAITQANAERFAEVYDHFGIEPLPDTIVAKREIDRNLLVLKREKCDAVATNEVATLLAGESYRREAAIALTSFSEKCTSSEPALSKAYNLYKQISDAKQMVATADKLIELRDFHSTFYYWRGLGHVKDNNHKRALDDFITAVGLNSVKKQIVSNVFVHQAEMYDKLGRPCEAMTPIQAWVSFDPTNRDTVQTQRIIANYSAKGKCDSRYAKGAVRLPIGNANSILVNAKVNGVRGRFVLDTGASFVTVSKTFAEQAKLSSSNGGKVTLQSANGIVIGQSTVAERMSIGEAGADKVTVVIMPEKRNPFGRNIDGLLGLSFLARFDLKIDSKYWSLAAKKSLTN